MLVDWEIMELIETGALIIEPFDESLINPASLDFRLGDKFSKLIAKPKQFCSKEDPKEGMQLSNEVINFPYASASVRCIEPRNSNSFKNLVYTGNKYYLKPGEFVIATTLEKFNFKGGEDFGIAAKVAGKSSLGRLGLANSSMAGFIDPGFAAEITLELFNYGSDPIILETGMKIGQLIFHKTKLPKRDYTKTGRYMNQESGQGSKGI